MYKSAPYVQICITLIIFVSMISSIETFKSAGNDFFKRSMYIEAINSYDEAIKIALNLTDSSNESVLEDNPVDMPLDLNSDSITEEDCSNISNKPKYQYDGSVLKSEDIRLLLSILWSNRSACNLSLHRYQLVS
jgi:hypothetical protein